MPTYAEIQNELELFKMMVHGMGDTLLISNILDMAPDEDIIDRIIYDHLQFREDLTELERTQLVWYYVLYNVEVYYNID